MAARIAPIPETYRPTPLMARFHPTDSRYAASVAAKYNTVSKPQKAKIAANRGNHPWAGTPD
jgi:hypothetical protein